MSTDYSFYALLCGYMPRPEGVQKRRTRVLLFFCAPFGSENPEYASLSGRLGGCKLSSTRLPTASSAVEPLRGYRREEREFFSFLFYVVSAREDGIGYCANLQFAPLYAHPYRSPRGHFQSLKADYGYFFIYMAVRKQVCTAI